MSLLIIIIVVGWCRFLSGSVCGLFQDSHAESLYSSLPLFHVWRIYLLEISRVSPEKLRPLGSHPNFHVTSLRSRRPFDSFHICFYFVITPKGRNFTKHMDRIHCTEWLLPWVVLISMPTRVLFRRVFISLLFRKGMRNRSRWIGFFLYHFWGAGGQRGDTERC